MEMFFPLVVVLLIGSVKLFGALSQRRRAEDPDADRRPRSPLARFLEELAEELRQPRPSGQPAWPKNRERPDYVHEMEIFQGLENAPGPQPAPERGFQAPEEEASPEPAPGGGFQPLEAPPPLPVSPIYAQTARTAGSAFRIEGRDELRRAMIAHIVLELPRALEPALGEPRR